MDKKQGGMEMKACFQSTPILLPKKQISMYHWSVVACDQYTSQKDYWQDVEKLVNNQPSTYHLIFPEVYLETQPERIPLIHQTMNHYLDNDILEEKTKDGFVLVERDTESGKRLGLVGVIDLEAYDFTPGTSALIRATEGTIQSRIPPRLKIREGAPIELPHVMVLIDDPKKQLIESLYAQKDQFECLYDTDLMMNGGHIKGYLIQEDKAQEVNQFLYQLQEESNGFFLAVGDGNHSLATAKAYWEHIKTTLTDSQDHPARYAMVELVNLHSPALIFEPIHRVLFHVNIEDLLQSFKTYLKDHKIQFHKGNDMIFIDKDGELGISLLNTEGKLPIDILQHFLDEYMESHQNVTIDYVHGDEALMTLGKTDNNCGIQLGSIDKNTLFPAIAAGGVLPRKTFSMGEAYEKRYYMESRKILK